MKKNKIELDVDFIGGEGPLTKEDSKVISEYLKNYNAKHTLKKNKRARKSSIRKRKVEV